MLKLPGRGKERVPRSNFISPYKGLFKTLNERGDVRKDIKKTIQVENEVADKIALSGAIRLQDVEKSFGKKTVLQGVNLEIKPGKIFGIIGASGSGKTTILRLIIGFYKPTK